MRADLCSALTASMSKVMPTSVFDLSLKPFGDGGWYWFDLAASSAELLLENGQWETHRAGVPAAK